MDKISWITILGIIAIIMTLVIVIEYKQKEYFTELYFTDIDDLPKEMLKNQVYNISFTLSSHEKDSKTYDIEIISSIQNKTITSTILPGQNKTTRIKIIPDKISDKSKFSIKCDDLEIYFYYTVK